MPDNRHPFDQLADDLGNYIETAADNLVEGMMPNGRAPLAAKLTRAQQDAYYAATYEDDFYLPDGTPNLQGQDVLTQTFGADAFLEIARAVIAVRRQRGLGGEAMPPDPLAPVQPPLAYPEFEGQGSPPVDLSDPLYSDVR